jgi:ribosomal subunit interface protein
MSLRVTGKHMEIGDAFRGRIEDRLTDSIGKYFDGGFSGHVIVEKSGSRYAADCRLHLDTGTVLQAAGEAQDPQLAFDAAAERLEKRLRRFKRRLKSHQTEPVAFDNVAYRVMAPVAEDEDEVEGEAPAVIAESSVSLRRMSVASAVFELDLQDSPVLAFRNLSDGQVNIVYRRADGNIGWIDPSAVTPGRESR